ncbi:MAG: hypothetical protein ACI9JO_001527 [Psychrobacter okhotskensis]
MIIILGIIIVFIIVIALLVPEDVNYTKAVKDIMSRYIKIPVALAFFRNPLLQLIFFYIDYRDRLDIEEKSMFKRYFITQFFSIIILITIIFIVKPHSQLRK